MRRAPIVVSATVFGTAAVLGFHAHGAATPIPTVARTSTSTSPPSSSTTAAASSSSSTRRTRTTATSSHSATATATGSAMNTRYGPAQVRVTVSNDKIVKVEAVELQSIDPKSQAISSYAAPVLQQSVLSKQTAAVDTVSGATYTSLSYEASLQSALDKLGYKAPDGSVASTDVSQLQ
ncbi:MAG TPA: FMN-binding protein [Thermoleophilaceae bacterium]|nr:FMN-binding protein [Thermoleophilaceae bacterium]